MNLVSFGGNGKVNWLKIGEDIWIDMHKCAYIHGMGEFPECVHFFSELNYIYLSIIYNL